MILRINKLMACAISIGTDVYLEANSKNIRFNIKRVKLIKKNDNKLPESELKTKYLLSK